MVDNLTDNLCNATLGCARKLQNCTLEHMEHVIFRLLEAGYEPRLSKADVSKAYRRLPVRADDIEFTAMVYIHEGKQWITFHYAMPFGAVGSVWAFHRVANVVMAFVRRKGRAPILKYVDDWFTASKVGVTITGIDIVQMVMMCLGIPLDPRKTQNLEETLVILGARLTISWARRGYYLCVDEGKRARWMKKDENVWNPM